MAIQGGYQNTALAELPHCHSVSLRPNLDFQILCLGAMSPWRYPTHGFYSKLLLVPKYLSPGHGHNKLSFDGVKQAGTWFTSKDRQFTDFVLLCLQRPALKLVLCHIFLHLCKQSRHLSLNCMDQHPSMWNSWPRPLSWTLAIKPAISQSGSQKRKERPRISDIARQYFNPCSHLLLVFMRTAAWR